MKQGTKEWLELRKKYIGASDAPVIMGVSPWTTPLQLWEEKLGIKGPRESTEAMRQGLVKEDSARNLFYKLTDIQVFPDVIFHENEFMMASLDGIDLTRKHALEIKSPFKIDSPDHELALEGKIPQKYYPQLQHQLECLNLDVIYYLSYYNDNSYKLIEVERDQKYIDKMIPKLQEFHRRMIEIDPPSSNENDYEYREDNETKDLEKRYFFLKSYVDEFEEVKNKLIERAEGKNMKVGNLTISRFMRKGTVDYKKIPELKSVDLDVYRKSPSLCWRVG